MKKNLFITILILFSMSANSLSAKQVRPAQKIKPKINLSEIVLDTKQEFLPSQTQSFLTDGAITGQAAVAEKQVSAETNQCTCANKKKLKLFVFLNPLRPITKAREVVNKCADCVDCKVDKGLEKLDKTPF